MCLLQFTFAFNQNWRGSGGHIMHLVRWLGRVVFRKDIRRETYQAVVIDIPGGGDHQVLRRIVLGMKLRCCLMIKRGNGLLSTFNWPAQRVAGKIGRVEKLA